MGLSISINPLLVIIMDYLSIKISLMPHRHQWQTKGRYYIPPPIHISGHQSALYILGCAYQASVNNVVENQHKVIDGYSW